jgi:hypothetical protein
MSDLPGRLAGICIQAETAEGATRAHLIELVRHDLPALRAEISRLLAIDAKAAGLLSRETFTESPEMAEGRLSRADPLSTTTNTQGAVSEPLTPTPQRKGQAHA